MLEGHTDELRMQNRLIARWLSPVMSALTGGPIPAEVLLGEKTPEQVAEEDRERKIREGRAREKHVLRQLQKLKSHSTKKE